jgi:hypothetical protein
MEQLKLLQLYEQLMELKLLHRAALSSFELEQLEMQHRAGAALSCSIEP